MATTAEATLDDLYRVAENGKAELVHGEIVRMSPTGGVPGRAGGEMYIALHAYERRTKRGFAFPDNVGFTVNLSHRKVKMTTAMLLKKRWHSSAQIILQPARSLYGTLMF